MIERLRPDRLPNREPAWYAADAVLVFLLGFLTIDAARSDMYIAEYGRVQGLAWLWVLAPSALVLLRRTLPATAALLAALAYVLAGFEAGEGNSILAAPFLAYSVALTRPPRMSALIVALAAVPASATTFYGPGRVVIIAFPVSVLFFGLGWVVGTRVRHSQLRARALAEAADVAREEAAEAAERAVADERARIARELHDAVGHAVNVMVMQAGAARLVADDERTIGSLREIERVGRSALSDLDRMLGLLRSTDDDRAPLEPAHGLADIDQLIAGIEATGAEIRFDDRCRGTIDPAVERPIGAAAYRIVQEALTNVVKHAGPARVEVALTCDDDELVVCVVDDGRGAATEPVPGGRGLLGMRERVAVLGGRLDAGPRSGGGFRVEAHLPRQKEHR
jgi:signal transduction histidine kinase